jgi:steroid delta-isomerase-like uncharacterized protein
MTEAETPATTANTAVSQARGDAIAIHPEEERSIMSTEENKAVVRRFFAALDDQDLDAVAALLAPDYRLHFDGNPEMDRAAGTGFFGAFLAAFPDITHQVQDQIAEGDRVATRIVVRGTHQTELMGIPATGNEMSISATNVVRIDHDKIAEHWVNSDGLGMMMQLGAIPPPGR